MTDKNLTFNELDNIDSLVSIFGLSFPESATEFQKAGLTLAHLMICVRDCILKGRDVTPAIMDLLYNLVSILVRHEAEQR